MQYIIAADVHAGGEDSDFEEFFRALQKLSMTSFGIIFLGDIFDCWIALDGYETPDQVKFKSWCSRQRLQRTLIYVEGDHDFFVFKKCYDCFSWVSQDSTYEDGTLFTHGDIIDRRNSSLRMVKQLFRNSIVEMLLPIIKKKEKRENIKAWIADKLEAARAEYGDYLPQSAIEPFMADVETALVRNVVCAHYHSKQESMVGGKIRFSSIEAWSKCRKLALYDTANGEIRYIDIDSIVA